MTTHQLATMLDHLRNAFADNLKAGASNEFSDVSGRFRELPDQSLKDLVKWLRQAASPARAVKVASAVDLPALIARIRSLRESQPDAESAIDLDALKLNNSQLKEILKAFGEKPTNTVAGNLTKVRHLLRAVGTLDSPPLPAEGNSTDSIAVDEGVRIYNALLADRKLSIPDVRAGFEPLRRLFQRRSRRDFATRRLHSCRVACRHREPAPDEPRRDQTQPASRRSHTGRHRFIKESAHPFSPNSFISASRRLPLWPSRLASCSAAIGPWSRRFWKSRNAPSM